MYDAMEAAEDFVDNWTFEEFAADLKTQFAVIRALEIIGEATKNIPYEVTWKISFCSLERPGRNTGQIDPLLFRSESGSGLVIFKEGIPEAKPEIKHILDEMWITVTSERLNSI